jgi:pimeloyl-ACP methyl ester carboxylesterase
VKLLRRILIALSAFAALGYAGACVYFFVVQRSVQYVHLDDPVIPLADTKLVGAENVAIPTTDSAVVNGWYKAPEPGEPLIFFCKGDWGSFSGEHERYEAWTAAGYGFLAFDYRGFPATPGTITQQHILDDALSAYDWAKAKGLPIVAWGRSLGSGPCTYVAGLRQPDALLLETPFLSAVDVALDRYPYLPAPLIVLDQFPVKDWIGRVQSPVFVAHGTHDTSIDVHHGKAVYALAPNQHGLWLAEGADHGDLWARGIWPKADAFFTEVEQAKATPR